jgi:hypothetical protein
MQDSSEYLWDPSAGHDPEIVRLERALAPFRYRTPPPKTARLRRYGVWASAALLLLIAGAATISHMRVHPWSLKVIAGNARNDGAPVRSGQRAARGVWLETDSASALRIAVGRAGVADLSADSRLQVVETGPDEDRLRLDRGTLHVTVWAPPRRVIVETHAATIVDLGCVYSLRVDRAGQIQLAVRQGEVNVEAAGRVLLVTAGTEVGIDITGQPGVPFPIGGSPTWRARLDAVARGDAGDSSLTSLLQSPHGPEVISLWHLTWRVAPAMRGRIYDALAPLAPRGAAVRRADVVRLDPTAMERWRQALSPLWSVEPATWLGRLLLRAGIRKPAVPLQFQ